MTILNYLTKPEFGNKRERVRETTVEEKMRKEEGTSAGLPLMVVY